MDKKAPGRYGAPHCILELNHTILIVSDANLPCLTQSWNICPTASFEHPRHWTPPLIKGVGILKLTLDSFNNSNLSLFFRLFHISRHSKVFAEIAITCIWNQRLTVLSSRIDTSTFPHGHRRFQMKYRSQNECWCCWLQQKPLVIVSGNLPDSSSRLKANYRFYWPA